MNKLQGPSESSRLPTESKSPANSHQSSAQPAIKLTGLHRHFGIGDRRVHAVRGVDLTIERGEVVALLGPNGAGKTTTLDMLLGLSEPDSGSVSVLGQHPRPATADGMLAAVLQTGGLLADITVQETIQIIAGFHHATNRIPEIMERSGLTKIAKRKIGKCSGGEQQRVKFALALIPDPDVLVLDEPTAGMDVNARRQFWEIMKKDANAGRTIVFATHYLEEAQQFARRTIVMNHGKIIADGDTSQLRASLGGRTVTATLPATNEATRSEILQNIATVVGFEIEPGLTEETGQTAERGLKVGAKSGIHIDNSKITVRTAHSDQLAAHLLSIGASDLEITAPTLETAFTALTEEQAS